MEVKAWSYKQDSLAAGLVLLMRSSAQRPLLGALRAFERPLFRRAHGPTLGSRRHKMRVRRQHKAPTALTSLTEKPGFRGLPARVFSQRRPAKRPAKLPILLFIELE